MVVSGSRPREPLSFCRSRGGDAGLRLHRPEVISGENRLLLRLRVPSSPGSDEKEVPPVLVRYKSGKKRCKGGNQSSLYFGAYLENTLRAPVPPPNISRVRREARQAKERRRNDSSSVSSSVATFRTIPSCSHGGRKRGRTSFRFSCVSPLPPPSMRSSYPLGKRGKVSLPLRLRRWGSPLLPTPPPPTPPFPLPPPFPRLFLGHFLLFHSLSPAKRPHPRCVACETVSARRLEGTFFRCR